MPTVPPATINDIPRAARQKVLDDFYERAVLQYGFSYRELFKRIRKLFANQEVDDPEGQAKSLIESSIATWTEDESKKMKDSYKDKISSYYTQYGIDKTLRDTDPFGRRKDYIMMEGTSATMSQDRALDIATAGFYSWKCPSCKKNVFTNTCKADTQCPTPDCKFSTEKESLEDKDIKVRVHVIAADVLRGLFRLATNKSTYVAIQVRDVKEGK